MGRALFAVGLEGGCYDPCLSTCRISNTYDLEHLGLSYGLASPEEFSLCTSSGKPCFEGTAIVFQEFEQEVSAFNWDHQYSINSEC